MNIAQPSCALCFRIVVSKKVWFIAFFFLLSACSSPSTQLSRTAEAQGQCDFLPASPQPDWILGNTQLTGYYTGIGETGARSGRDNALKLARINALTNLSGSIRTNVKQQLTVGITETGSEDRSIVQSQIDSFSKAITDNSVKNIEQDGLWLDKKSCRLWMRLKVSVKDVEAIQNKNLSRLRLNQANTDFSKAANIENQLAMRLSHIEDAIRRVERIDFSLLPLEHKSDYLTKFRRLQTQILTKSGSNEVLVITTSSQDLPKAVHKEIAYRLSRGIKNSLHIYPSPCNQSKNCLHYAESLGAKSLIFVEATASVSVSDMGSYIGDLAIDSTLLEVASGRQLSYIQNQVGQVLSFDLKKMKWEQAIKRMFTDNAIISSHIKRTRHCTSQVC
jgi:hypothetical protein